MEETHKKYIEVRHVWNDPWEDDRETVCEFRFRRPSRSELGRFSKDVVKSAALAQSNLLIGIVHGDDAERLKTDLELHPGLSLVLAAWVMKGLGVADLGN